MNTSIRKAAFAAVINGSKKTARTTSTLYHTAAFLSLAAWIYVGAAGDHSGFAQLTVPLGRAIATVDGTKLSEDATHMKDQAKKQEQHADASPAPGHKPTIIPAPIPTPPKPTQLQ